MSRLPTETASELGSLDTECFIVKVQKPLKVGEHAEKQGAWTTTGPLGLDS